MDNEIIPPQQPLSSPEDSTSSVDKKSEQNITTSKTNTSLLKLIAAYGLITGLIGAILLGGFFLTRNQNTSAPSATPTITVVPTNNHTPTPTITEDPLGKSCGGRENIQCPAGYKCRTDVGYSQDKSEGICVLPRPQSVEGEFCGGVAAFQCQEGLACLFDNIQGADIGGKCVKVPKSPNSSCRFDAKQCSDGSYVAREGPSCEFAKCPEE